MKTLIYSLLIVCIFISCKKETESEFVGKNKVTLKFGSVRNLVIILEDNAKLYVGDIEKRDTAAHLVWSTFSFSTNFSRFKLQIDSPIDGTAPIKYAPKTTDWINTNDTIVLNTSMFKF
jgi:hypothetical protein